MTMNELKLIAVAFGELEISSATVSLMIGLALFTFVAVGLSSLKLIQSMFKEKKDKE